MADFDEHRAAGSFRPAHAGRGRRRATALLFVAQATPAGEARFVVKGHAAPGDAPGAGRARLQRELDGQAAFAALGEAVLRPCAGPFERLELNLDGRLAVMEHALVYPYLPAPTLFDLLRDASLARGAPDRTRGHAQGGRRGGATGGAAGGATGGAMGGATGDDAEALLVRAAARIAARHARARRVADLHSDGAAHNILVLPAPGAGGGPQLAWFDFAEPHAAADVPEARAVELLAFLLSVVEASRAGHERGRIAAACAAYPDRAVLARVLALRTPRRPALHALRHRLRLRSWVGLWRGDTTQLARYRLLRALRAVLAGSPAHAAAAGGAR